MGKSKTTSMLIPQEKIVEKIYWIRGHRVMLDRDLAALYGVSTGNLNKAVNRNLESFPDDFMFSLKPEEYKNLIFQIGRSSWGGTRKRPRGFTEHGVLMLSSVLKSQKARKVNILIVRAFIRLRQILETHEELREKIEELEKKFGDKFKEQDQKIQVIFEAVKRLLEPPEQPKRRIGFHS